ncbi:uncharacterized protein LOC121418475 isoform X2 [Lytechinus variegatus]|uniref:uncharacterized protein LOC121418475 isoform X2 n=1 Tax=Lytechinus variegatus TaxID=7654 RepID=UPI001BB1CCF3|nr:uncharacterized protein LOC121418475 isoform X2 [Lytechinus variegatus]
MQTVVQIGYLAFTIFLMVTFWVTEVIPLPVTALIPIVLFPLFGIRDTPTVIEQYFNDVTYLLLGGLILAAAIEHQNLHRRFALRVLLLFGTDPKKLLLGFMSGTAFLSSWMSNTAVTAMMLPIARAVLDEIKTQDNDGEHEIECDLGENVEYKPNNQTVFPPEKQMKGFNRNGQELQREEMDSVVDLPPSPSSVDQDRCHLRLCKAIFLCIPYAANIGGTGSLVGTRANVVCVAVVESLFGKETGLNFGTWTLYCYPQMIVCVLLIWVWLQFMYLPRNSFRCKSNRESTSKAKKIRKVIQRAYDDLGPIRFAEWAILAHFVIIIALWITQDPKVFPGWASLFPPGVKSSAPTILIAISLFCFPSERPLRLIRIRDQQMRDSAHGHLESIVSNGASVAGVNSDDDDGDDGRENHPKIAKVKCIPALINWEIVHEKMPWGVLIVVGGGFALADGCVESGLSLWLAEQFEIFYGIPPLAVAFSTAIIISLITELTANVVTTTIFLPIVAEMAVAMRINPLYLMLTTTICASFAFMLPVATTSNAIAFANKEIKVIDMMGYVAFTIFLMGTFWVTEVIPLPVTALMPIVLFPLFGIRDTPTVVEQYFKNVTYLLFGGLILAAAIEHQNLHRRFALRVLLLFGTDPKKLLLGFMSGTAFLSSWMSNTAVTAMMLPIARAVLDEIKKQDNDGEHEMACDLGENGQYQPSGQTVLPPEKQMKGIGHELLREEIGSIDDLPSSSSSYDQDKRHLRLRKAIFLCITYAANVGGTGSLVGTSPNVICVAVVESLFGKETGLNFGSWMLFCYPQMIVCILVIWAWLQFMYLPRNSFRCKCNRQNSSDAKHIRKVIQRAYDDLGPVRFAEWAVLGHFVIIVALWITQDPKVFPGWASLFPPGVKSATPTMLMAISLFCFPSERPLRLLRIKDQQIRESAHGHLESIVSNGESASVAGVNSDDDDGRESRPKIAKVKCIPALINWEIVHEKIPWGVLIIMGGGLALADGCVESGLSAWLAEQFQKFYGIPPLAVAFITAITISLLTEVMANTVTAAIFVPIVAEMAVAMRINPLYLILTTTICASFAFMLPVATGPNAIAFAYKEIKVIDMVKTGCLLNFTCICILLLFMNTLGLLIFDIAHFPDWANNTMNTMATDNIFHNSTSVPF